MAARKVYTPAMDDWMRAEYGRGDPVARVLEDFAAEFGWQPSMHGFSVHACRLGLRKGNYGRDAPERAVRKVVWSREPEKQRWMEENAEGKSIAEVSRLFCEEFGFPLSRPQVSGWRVQNGISYRRSTGRQCQPVGSIRDSKGYLLVKVAERPRRRGTKDNWRLLNAVKWEQYNGCPLPKGHVVLFANRDIRDFREENLVAVPRSLVARVNAADSPEWDDRESLLACIAWCRLGSSIANAEAALPRKCGVCGREFVPDLDRRSWAMNRRTCRACIEAGHKAKGVQRAKSGPATAVCAVCGREFTKERSSQVRCRSCIDRWPKYEAEKARSIYRKEHGL